MISSTENLQGIPEKPESRKEVPDSLRGQRELRFTWVLASLGARMQQFWVISKHTGRVQDKAGFLSRVEDLESRQGWFHRFFQQFIYCILLFCA